MFKNILQKIKNDTNLLELLTGSIVSFIFKIIGMLLGYLVMIYITRNYGASIYGTLSLSIGVFSTILLFAKLGMDTALIRFVSEEIAQKKYRSILPLFLKVMFLISISSLIMTIFLFYSAYFIAEYFFHKAYLKQSFQIISLSLFPAVFTTIVANIFQGLKQIKIYALLSGIILNSFFLVFLIISDRHTNIIELYLYAYLSTMVVAAVIILIFFIRIGIKLNTKTYSYKQIFDVSLPVMFASTFGMLISVTDIFMLGIMKNELDVGIYSVITKLVGITSIALMAMNTISAPKFAELNIKKDFINLEKVILQSTKIIFFVSTPLILLFLLFSKEILLFFGKEFIIGSSALIYLSIGQFVNIMSGSVGVIAQMTGLQKLFQNIILFAAFLNIILNYILIPKFGITGAAIASMLSMICWNLLLVFFIKRKHGFLTLYIPSFFK